MSRFLETDIKEQKNMKKRIQTSKDNTVSDLGHEIRFENRVKKKTTLFNTFSFLFFFFFCRGRH